jgi:hypothetical protein
MKRFQRVVLFSLCLCLIHTWAFANNGPGGLVESKLFSANLTTIDGVEMVEFVNTGTVKTYNTRDHFQVKIDPINDCETAETWKIKKLNLYVGADPVPIDAEGFPLVNLFPYQHVYEEPINDFQLVLPFQGAMQFQWGEPYEPLRKQNVAVYAQWVQLDSNGDVIVHKDVWTFNPEFEDAGEMTEVLVVGQGVHERKITRKKKSKGNALHKMTGILNQMLLSHWGWFTYEMAHPKVAHVIDSPVGGLSYEGPTQSGTTDETGSLDYFPGERVKLLLGSVLLGEPLADHKVTPLDIFEQSDIDDPRVINMARFLQSLDVDGDPQGGITITEEVVKAFESTMGGQETINFSDGLEVEGIIQGTIDTVLATNPESPMVAQSAEDAKAHLEDTLNNSMFRKNVSKTPEFGSSKAKMNVMTVWLPALKANGEPAEYTDKATGEVIEGVPYFDEEGNRIRTATEAKPIVVTYTDADPETGAHDTYAAISRDDGSTWKRKNLSRSADLSSFTLANGESYYGATKKPVFQVKGNKILVAWSSKFARGGMPRYAIQVCPDSDGDGIPDPCVVCKGDDENEHCEPDYTHDDPYYTDDIWGVGGPQRSHDYTEDGFPEVGEVPYSALWIARGLILTNTDLEKSPFNSVNSDGEPLYALGDIVWFKPERVTSGRRDVNQIFCGAASGAGFGLIWHEDPEGLRPGRAVGPGPGWGGATTNHKTDIWYSYIAWGDHTKIDSNFVAGGDPEHDLDHITRPKALVPMSLPVRISDNDVLNRKNMGLDETTTADAISYTDANLTRCVKFEGGLSIAEPGSPEAETADYTVLRAVPADHYSSMNCTNCHVPYGTEPMGETPTQGAPIPLVVVNAETQDYLGGFTNGDCVSCHYSHIVPRDRVIAMAPGTDEATKIAECSAKGGIWKDGSDGGEIVDAYYPYEGYPYIFEASDINDGTHRYGLAVEGLLTNAEQPTPQFYTFENNAGNETSVAITTDGRLLDGDTGASRPNLFLQPYVNAAGKTSAWAIITYEETKGAGAGPPEETGVGESHSDDYIIEEGKNVIYHSFDFQNPDLVSAGHIMNQPECETTLDENNNVIPVEPFTPKYLVDENGVQILDYLGRPQLAYENARRGRFILQGWGAVRGNRTIMLTVYKMGQEGSGRSSDIMMQRWVIPEDEITFKYKDGKINGVISVEGNPYRFENILGDYVLDGDENGDGVIGDDEEKGSGQWYWASGPVNMSSVTPTETTPSMGDPEQDDAYGAVKVVEWTQTIDNLADLSGKNRYDDARAHRGQIRGDFVQLGFSYTPNWAAARNGNDKYDFFIRRSFNGGKTWTTDPKGTGTEHCITWTTPSGLDQIAGTKEEECFSAGAGEFERMRNLSQLPNAKESVIEPRIVAVPGTIKKDGTWTGKKEDKQNPTVFYVAYGTSTNPKKDPITGEQEEPAPLDLYYSFSRDKGETYHEDEWVINGVPVGEDAPETGETVTGWGWLAKGDAEQGEVQLRMTPDGSRFYSCWLDEGIEASDIFFRRIMSSDFPQNNAELPEDEVIVAEEEVGSSDDDTSDSGGDDSD